MKRAVPAIRFRPLSLHCAPRVRKKQENGGLSVGKEMAVMMRGVTKRFGSVIANDHVDLDVREGEILAVLGENGSGKTTLMNMLSGIYFPDEGQVSIHGKNVTIRDPRDAYELGIGMIHQHFKLVDVFTAAENIILGLPGSARLDMKQVAGKIRELCERYGFELDPNQKIYDMSVSQKQTVEILKVLYRGADILILDEPTAVLTPQETERLFAILRNMRADGKSIVIITHKLHEVMEISDRVAVLRKGKFIGDIATSETNPQQLTDMMVGRAVTLNIDRPEPKDVTERLVVKNLTVLDNEGIKKLDNVSFTAYGGELLGIAGISGSGQKEQNFTLAGVLPGTYDLVVTKSAHLKYTVKNVTVGNAPLDLTKLTDEPYQTITLLCGDINGDESINVTDLNEVWDAANFNKNAGAATNKLTDINGDGSVNVTDLNVIWDAANFNKGVTACTYDF